MLIGGTLIQYYALCKRKCWLVLRGITMEHTSERVAMGRDLHESSYRRRPDSTVELSVGGCKIDHYNPVTTVVHETKLTNKVEWAHELQIKLYIYELRRHQIPCVGGQIDYPKLHKSQVVDLDETGISQIEKALEAIESLSKDKVCPPVINSRICKMCSFEEFCYGDLTDPGVLDS